MEKKRFHLPDQESHTISGHALTKLLRRADGNATLLYLYILQQHGALNDDAMESLRLSERELSEAIRTLTDLGLVSGHKARRTADDGEKEAKPQELPEAEELPQYAAAEIEREMSTDAAFSALVKAVGGMTGKILTAPELNTLMGIYRHLGLPPEVIYQLVSHLTKEHRARYGEGKSPTLRGIEKVAYIWARDGIVTLDAAMSHIARREQTQSDLGQLKKVLDLPRDKALTPTQEKYLFRWMEMGFDLAVIARAYDKTVVSTGSLKWPYLNAILSDWHKKDLLTAESLEIAEPGGKSGRKPAAKPPSNAPDRQEIERKRRLLNEMK